MKPIILTQFGDTLRLDTVVDHDDKSLDFGVKWHSEKCYNLDVYHISETHYRIVCRKCGTIVIVPKEIDSYGKLRQWCAQKIAQEKVKESEIACAISKTRVFGPLKM